MKTLVTVCIAALFCNTFLFGQERPNVTGTTSTTTKPVETEQLSPSEKDPVNPEEEDKTNRDLLLELLEKSKKERVGYFEANKGLTKPYTVNMTIDPQLGVRITNLEKEIQDLKIKMDINKVTRKEFEGLKPDSLVQIKVQSLREVFIEDSIKHVAKQADLEQIQIPQIYFDTIRLYLLDARLNRIVVTVKDDNGFYSNNVPISITSYKSRKNDQLYYQGSNDQLIGSSITLGQFLNYTCLTERLTYPPDTTIYITKANTKAQLYNTGKQLDYFDVRLYTDTKGLSGESNGLIQTEINASFYGSTKNWKNKNITSVPFVRLHLGISKFDSKFDTLQLNSLSNRTGTDYLRMTQYSNLNLRVETDLIRYSRIHDGYLTLGHQMQSTVISDTIGNAQRVFSPSFYSVLGGTMFSYPRIKCEFKLPVHYCYLMDQPFVEYERKWEFMIIPEIEIVLDPVKDEGSQEVDGTRIFGRVKYFDLTDYRGGNFWQVQLGAQISLSDAFKK